MFYQSVKYPVTGLTGFGYLTEFNIRNPVTEYSYSGPVKFQRARLNPTAVFENKIDWPLFPVILPDIETFILENDGGLLLVLVQQSALKRTVGVR